MKLTLDIFQRFLSVLDPDPERAGVKYEQMRDRLIRFFTTNGCASAEDLADEVINRVVQKMPADAELDNVNLYLYGVAKLTLLESRKSPRTVELPDLAMPKKETAEVEIEYECLDQCLAQLPTKDRYLILRYYQGDKLLKIENRSALAEELGVSTTALRVRAHRIRVTLQRCINGCLKQKAQRS